MVGILKVWGPACGVLASQQVLDCGGDMAMSLDGRLLAWGGNGQLHLFDGPDACPVAPLCVNDEERRVQPVLFSQDGKYLLTGVGTRVPESIGEVKFWDIASRRELFTLPTGWVMSLALSGDGRTLAVGLVEGDVQVWELATRRQVFTSPAHEAQVRSIAFHPSGALLATAGMSESLKLWDLTKRRPACRVLSPGGPGAGVNAVAFLPSTGELLTGDEAGNIAIWDTKAGKTVASYKTTEAFTDMEVVEGPDQVTIQAAKAPEVSVIALSADGTKVATGDVKGAVQLWAVEPAPCPSSRPTA
jgi:WD40 repeat protein